jgi:hypothetical protein
MEFVSYLRYRGMPVEELGADSREGEKIRIYGGKIAEDGSCFFSTLRCRPGRPEAEGLVVVLPDDPVPPGQEGFYAESAAKLLSGHASVAFPPFWSQVLQFLQRLG